MANWNLLEIRKKVRQVTGRYSSNEFTNDQIDDKINKYYQFIFPMEVKLEELLSFYEFLTTANQQFYSISSDFTDFSQEAFINNRLLDFYIDPDLFLTANPENYVLTTMGTGDGSTTVFTATVSNQSILPGTLIVSDDIESFEDTNTTYGTANITLTASGGGNGTVNYSTGVVSVTFNTAPADGQSVFISYVQYVPSIPQAVLFYDNQFKFYPVPDRAYRFRIKRYLPLTALSASTDVPVNEQWGELIAYGASKEIFSDFGEMDAFAQVQILYKEQLLYVNRNTLQDLFDARATPTF